MQLSEVVVLSLKEDKKRRNYIDNHFRETGLPGYRYVEAEPANGPGVATAYQDGRVAAFPPCFRCGLSACKCANNILIPPQVANWLSFLKIWRDLPPDPDSYYLICEDDVAFHDGAMPLLMAFCETFQRVRPNVLIRLSESGKAPFQRLTVDRLRECSGVVMSNPAYIINGAMAGLLVRCLDRIETTSDIWLHKRIASRDDVQALTLQPLLATDLSFNADYAQFVSRIHPKGITPEDRERMTTHVKRVSSAPDYAAIRKKWLDGHL